MEENLTVGNHEREQEKLCFLIKRGNCHSLGQTNSQYSMRMTMTTTMTTTINSFTSPEIEEMKEGGKMLTSVCDGE
jgi:hypothetical protein